MMTKVIASSIILYIQCISIIAQFPIRRRPDASPANPTRPDPVSKILSDLSDFILDIDEEIGRQIAPRTNLDDVNEPVRKPSPRTTYLEKLRENYKDLQHKIASPLNIPDDFSLSSDFLGVNVKNQGRDVDVSLPPLRPIKIVARTNNPFMRTPLSSKNVGKLTNEDATSEEQNYSPDTYFSTEIKFGDAEVIGSKFGDDASLGIESSVLQRRSSEKKLKDITSKEVSEKETEFFNDRIVTELPDSTSDVGTFSSEEDSGSDDNESKADTGIGGRILGDVLYSESTFDKMMKRLIADHKSWTLDSELTPSKVFDRLNRVTQQVFGRNEEKVPDDELEIKSAVPSSKLQTFEDVYKEELNRNGIRRPVKPSKQKFNDVLEKRRKTALPSEFGHLEPRWQSEGKRNIAKRSEKTLLAFTPDGIPLKLKIAPESGNPFKYLHKILRKAGVSLNFPVNSYQDIEPAGTEILQLGAGKDGMNAQALNIDLSDSDQLDSLLRVLRLKPKGKE